MVWINRQEINKLVSDTITKKDVGKASEVKKVAQDNYCFDSATFMLGWIEHLKQNYKEAIKLYKKTLELSPDYKSAYNQIGNCYTSLGQYDDAIRWYNDYIRIFSSAPTAVPFFNRAVVHYRKEQLDMAISDCLRSIEQSESYASPYRLLLNIFFKLEKIEHVCELVDKILVALPQDYNQLNNLSVRLLEGGALLEEQGKPEGASSCYKKAQEVLEKALLLSPDSPYLHFNMACYYSRTGQKDDAIKELKRSIELDPKQKEKALMDKDFESLRDVEEFKKVLA